MKIIIFNSLTVYVYTKRCRSSSYIYATNSHKNQIFSETVGEHLPHSSHKNRSNKKISIFVASVHVCESHTTMAWSEESEHNVKWFSSECARRMLHRGGCRMSIVAVLWYSIIGIDSVKQVNSMLKHIHVYIRSEGIHRCLAAYDLTSSYSVRGRGHIFSVETGVAVNTIFILSSKIALVPFWAHLVGICARIFSSLV